MMQTVLQTTNILYAQKNHWQNVTNSHSKKKTVARQLEKLFTAKQILNKTTNWTWPQDQIDYVHDFHNADTLQNLTVAGNCAGKNRHKTLVLIFCCHDGLCSWRQVWSCSADGWCGAAQQQTSSACQWRTELKPMTIASTALQQHQI